VSELLEYTGVSLTCKLSIEASSEKLFVTAILTNLETIFLLHFSVFMGVFVVNISCYCLQIKYFIKSAVPK
jgi:hypothetical protein